MALIFHSFQQEPNLFVGANIFYDIPYMSWYLLLFIDLNFNNRAKEWNAYYHKGDFFAKTNKNMSNTSTFPIL